MDDCFDWVSSLKESSDMPNRYTESPVAVKLQPPCAVGRSSISAEFFQLQTQQCLRNLFRG